MYGTIKCNEKANEKRKVSPEQGLIFLGRESGMEIPKPCQESGCFGQQLRRVESAENNGGTDLCPLLAALAMRPEHSTPPIERHF